MATTKFRIEKKHNYTVVSNYHLQDKNLTLKAKGLLTLMLSLPEDWDYTLKGLVNLSKDGIDGVRAAILELEQNGYLDRYRPRNNRGQILCTEYTIREISTKDERYNEIGNIDTGNNIEPIGNLLATLENPM